MIMNKDKEVGKIWFDDEGNEYEVKSIQDTVVVSRSINLVDEEED